MKLNLSECKNLNLTYSFLSSFERSTLLGNGDDGSDNSPLSLKSSISEPEQPALACLLRL